MKTRSDWQGQCASLSNVVTKIRKLAKRMPDRVSQSELLGAAEMLKKWANYCEERADELKK